MSDNGISRLGGKLRLMVLRVVVGLVNDAAKMQAMQVQAYGEVVRDQAEHFQNYGLTSVPHPGAEGIGLSVGGSTNHLVVINVDDRRYRMKGMAAGEVALYDDLGQCVYLTRDGIVVKGAGKPILFTDTPLITFDAPETVFTGNVSFEGDTVEHGGTDIGHHHRHGGVLHGTDVSDDPI